MSVSTLFFPICPERVRADDADDGVHGAALLAYGAGGRALPLPIMSLLHYGQCRPFQKTGVPTAPTSGVLGGARCDHRGDQHSCVRHAVRIKSGPLFFCRMRACRRLPHRVRQQTARQATQQYTTARRLARRRPMTWRPMQRKRSRAPRRRRRPASRPVSKAVSPLALESTSVRQ